MYRVFLAVVLTLVAVAAVACDSSIPAADSSDSLASAMKAAGFEVNGPSENNPLDARIFPVAGVHYMADDEQVLAYEFTTVDEAREAAGLIAPDGYGIGSKYVQWGGPPHIHFSGRLIAVYVGDSSKVRETLTAAMGEQVAGEA